MEVVIDGIKYIPENDKTIWINGQLYGGVYSWLYDIRCTLLNQWACTVNDNEPANQSPKSLELFEKIRRFDKYTKEFLGFEYDSNRHVFVEIKK